MMQQAQQAQATSDAKATATEMIPVPDLPQGFPEMIGKHDSGHCDCSFRILGFVIGKDRKTDRTRHGKSFAPGDEGFYEYITWRITRNIPSGCPRPRFAAQVEERERERTAYYAVVQGNAVSCEDWLRQQGYSDAFAGSPTYVMVREV